MWDMGNPGTRVCRDMSDGGVGGDMSDTDTGDMGSCVCHGKHGNTCVQGHGDAGTRGRTQGHVWGVG